MARVLVPGAVPAPPVRFGGGRVHMHSVLAYRGGAARVVNMLRQGVVASGISCASSCEIYDASGSPQMGVSDTPTGNLPDSPVFTSCPSREHAGQTPQSPHNAQIFPVETACVQGQIVTVSPAHVGQAVQQGSLLHLHGSQDWAACLSGIAARHVANVITLHDCSLLTGGCPYPLDCQGIFEGCYDPCPRGFMQASTVQQNRLQMVRVARSHMVSPSRWLRKIARKVLPDVPCTVIPNGVEVPDGSVTREVARNRLGVSPHARVVLFMAHGGEQAAYKSGGQWFRVWEEIRQQVEGAVCFMVGGDRHEQNGNLIRWPYVDRENAQLFMAAADCFAYPTLADNHPLVVLEALSLGCPVVAYKTGGVVEQIVHGQTGLLVHEGDWQSFTHACVAVLASPSTRRNFAAEGAACFLRHFTAQRMVAEYLKLYAGCC